MIQSQSFFLQDGTPCLRWGVILILYVPVASFHFSEAPIWSIDKHKPQSHHSSIPSETSQEGRQGDSYLQDNLYLSNFLDVSSGHMFTQVNIRAAVQSLCRGAHVCRSLCRSCPTCPQPTVSLQCQSHSSGAVCFGAPLHTHTRAGRAPTALLAHTDSQLLLPLMPQAPLVSRGNKLKRSHHERIVQGMISTPVKRWLCCNDILFLWLLATNLCSDLKKGHVQWCCTRHHWYPYLVLLWNFSFFLSFFLGSGMILFVPDGFNYSEKL